jgi:CubicO group peptidase (beta-lactamase class C family)
MKAPLLWLALALLVPPWCAAAGPAPQPLVTTLQRALPGVKAGGFVVGESIDGKVQYTVIGDPLPLAGLAPERAIFEIGSISKVFTSLLLAQTVIEGKAALTDPISKYLPADLTLDPKVASITLEQLATHTSGLPRLPDNLGATDELDPYANFTPDRLDEFLRHYHPVWSPPQAVVYSNLGAGLLGHLLERIHGKPYATLLAEHITGPLGLPDTVISLSREQQARFATPYSGRMPVKPWQMGALQGAGAIRSTAADLIKFGEALLAPDSPIHPAWEFIRQARTSLGDSPKLGLGIFVENRRGETIYLHDGGTGGFRGYFQLAPATRRVIVVLLNNDSLELGPYLAGTLAPKPAAGDVGEEVPIEAARLTDYTGVYAISATERFTVIQDVTGRLRIRLTGQPFGSVLHLGSDRFSLKRAGAEFQFSRDASGQVTTLTLFQRGHKVPAQRTAEPVPSVSFLSPGKLLEYVGTYQLAPAVVIEITLRGDQLFAQITGQVAVPVFCDRPDHFAYDVVAAALTFERKDDGAVTALTIDQDGLSPRAPRLTDPRK